MRLIAPLCLVVLFIAGCGGGTTTVIQQGPSTTQAGTTTQATADCGQVTFSGAPTTIVVLRGSECSEAVQVATAFDASSPPSPWSCALAHAPLDNYPLPGGSTGVVGFSCGYGGSGDLRAAPHAFIGVTAASGGTTTSTSGPSVPQAQSAAQRAASGQVSRFGIHYAPREFSATCSPTAGTNLT